MRVFHSFESIYPNVIHDIATKENTPKGEKAFNHYFPLNVIKPSLLPLRVFLLPVQPNCSSVCLHHLLDSCYPILNLRLSARPAARSRELALICEIGKVDFEVLSPLFRHIAVYAITGRRTSGAGCGLRCQPQSGQVVSSACSV